MTQEDINKILKNHKHWLNRDCDGWENMRADFSNMNLYRADLCNTELCGAIFEGANLCEAALRNADLRDADCCNTSFYGANLQNTNFDGANLLDANFRNAILINTKFNSAKNVPHIPYICPNFGSFIGWKRAYDGLIVKLEIPEDAKRLSGTGRKCRCDKARVIEIQNLDGDKDGGARSRCSAHGTGRSVNNGYF